MESRAHLTDTQGYSMTIRWDYALGPLKTSIANDPRGKETLSQEFTSSMTVTNTTPGRNLALSGEFNSNFQGLVMIAAWKRSSAVCQNIFVKVSARFPGIGDTCLTSMASYHPTEALSSGAKEDLAADNVGSLDDTYLKFPGIPESAAHAITAELKGGPALWGLFADDNTQHFSTQCAPDGGDVFVHNYYLLDAPKHEGISCK